MKITDLSITLFTWDNIPQTSYGEHKRFGGSSQLGLLAISTDEGITGHAFLGSSRQAADIDAPALIRYLKPVVMGQDALDRERINQVLWKRARNTTTRAVGAIDVALWDIAGKAANMPIHKLLGSFRDRAPAYASSQVLPSAAVSRGATAAIVASSALSQTSLYMEPRLAGLPSASTARMVPEVPSMAMAWTLASGAVWRTVSSSAGQMTMTTLDWLIISFSNQRTMPRATEDPVKAKLVSCCGRLECMS